MSKRIVSLIQRGITSATTIVLSGGLFAMAADAPKTPDQWAKQYIGAFNTNNIEAIKGMRVPTRGESGLQDMIDGMTKDAMQSGIKWIKYEVLPAGPGFDKPISGPDGRMYEASVHPTNTVKFTSSTANGSTTTTSVNIGKKDGAYYEVYAIPSRVHQAPFAFGWQKFTPPGAHWSVEMPNEPEPGRATIAAIGGEKALADPDAYGVVEQSGGIVTKKRYFSCGESGKRIDDKTNLDKFTVSWTTFGAQTLKDRFNDVNKNLDDAIESHLRSKDGGTLVSKSSIEFKSSPGREFEVKFADGSTSIGREYWLDNQLFELIYSSKMESPDKDSCNKFLNSLIPG